MKDPIKFTMSMTPRNSKTVRSHRLFRFVALALPLLGGAGCFRSHTIEPGTWTLTILPKEEHPESRNYVPPPSNVEVSVDWGKEKGTEILTVVITDPPTENEPEGAKYTLRGELKDKTTPAGVVREADLQGVTKSWHVRVWPKVTSPRSMSGTMYAVMRRTSDKRTFEGIWKIVKVTPPRTQ